MFTMILSVVAFGHRLTQMQWLGVGLVFGGIGVEAGIARSEKMAKEAAKAKKSENTITFTRSEGLEVTVFSRLRSTSLSVSRMVMSLKLLEESISKRLALSKQCTNQQLYVNRFVDSKVERQSESC